MNQAIKSSTKKLRGALYLNGLDYGSFAERHGFKPETVKKAIRRHWGKDTRPHGKITLKILKALEDYCEKESEQ